MQQQSDTGGTAVRQTPPARITRDGNAPGVRRSVRHVAERYRSC